MNIRRSGNYVGQGTLSSFSFGCLPNQKQSLICTVIMHKNYMHIYELNVKFII